MSEYTFVIEQPFLPFDETNTKIAAFDYDWTIVKPNKARTFPKDSDDWQWLRPNVPIILKEYYNDDYSIYIFTNQTKQWKLDHIKKSLNTIGIPIKVIVGFGKDTLLKKPNPDLFNKVIQEFDKDISFYCGDAGGRSNDWSDVDIRFAKNVGINFKTPEECFPIELTKSVASIIDYEIETQEIIVLVGYPSAGKTTFAENKLNTYVIISGDLYKTTERSIKEAKKYIDNENSVVFDATNGKLDNRAKIIKFAKDNNIPIRCFVFNVCIEEAMEWNAKRASETDKKVPRIAFYLFRKHYIEPSLEEGFSEILHIL